ncbi:branched-chain amino acid ABC transporter permease [Variovorax paradoxus]|uniref:branched-chain amino acid ABC transporter permease n=1 Tax=Variovorax paradoxus TaxID=34073 RepID=UPI0019348CF4|nr:branched-chain amino acid ABC transporter permease [Variovorax paradoxus]
MSSSLLITQTLNSLAMGGVLFILSSGFSLIFGLMRVANFAHGALFMLGAYVGVEVMARSNSFLVAVVVGALAVSVLGAMIERTLLRRLAGQPLAQVLATLGVAFVVADGCLWYWGGDPRTVSAPPLLSGGTSLGIAMFPTYRLALIAFGLLSALILWALLNRTRIGVSIRASVDDLQMARGIGVPASTLFTAVFALGCALAGMGGVLASPILSVSPGMDHEMLPLALAVVILGGMGSLVGALVGSFVIGAIYSVGQVAFPELAYVVLFVPMVAILALRPRGLFGRVAT